MKLDWKLTHGNQTLVVNNLPFLTNAKLRLDWRPCGREGWNESIAVIRQNPSESSDTLTFEGVFTDAAEVRIIYKRLDAQTWEISGFLHNIGPDSIELARFHYLHGELADTYGLLAPQPYAEQCRLFRRGDKLPPVKEQTESLWKSMAVTWPRFADEIHQQPDWAIAVDTGILTPAWDAPGLFLGYTTPASAFGEIGLGTTSAQATCFAGLLLDGVRLDPGKVRNLDTLRLRWGDWQESMRIWAKACAEQAGVKKLRVPLVGYCSWYQMYHEIELEHIERANREFANWPIPPGGRTIQIDDGFQIMPGDWRPNQRFAKTWSELPAQIAKTGSTPGLWLAPHAIFHRHSISTEHPDWLQRLPSGKPAISFSNWSWSVGPDAKPWDPTEPTYFLDPDHPEARQFIFDVVADAVAAGWKYLKIDFAYAICNSRKAWNPYKTRMETLRDLFSLFREAAGPDTIISACVGEMARYALGLVDVARIGGDIAGDWNSIHRNLPDTLIRMSTNGIWWNGDPDVFHMRQENLQLNDEETWCLTGTIGALGGVFMTSDFPSQWSAEANEKVKLFWNSVGPQVPIDFHVAYTSEGVARAINFTYGDDSSLSHRIALYNWSSESTNLRIPISALRLPKSALTDIKYASHGEISSARIEGEDLIAHDMPPHGLRIIEISRQNPDQASK